MSINVTVTGNPVNIKKGKMVCCDPYNAKKEFQSRRLMRLEQVRQQSKDIAEKVRTKVQKEKCKQVSEIEKEGKEKLKKWQAKKLLELQNQYKEAIKDIGLGHKEAAICGNDSDIILEQTEKNEEISRERGQKAAEKLQIKRNDANYKQARSRQQHKMARDIENTRSALITSVHKNGKSPFKKKKKRKRKKPPEETNISPDDSDSETDTDYVPQLDIESSNTSSEDENGISNSSDLLPEDGEMCKCDTITARKTKQNESITKDEQTSTTKFDTGRLTEKSIQAFPEEGFKPHLEVPVDTRISDRIKRRALSIPKPDFCDVIRERICTCDDFTRPPCYCKNQSSKQDKGTSYTNLIRSDQRLISGDQKIKSDQRLISSDQKSSQQDKNTPQIEGDIRKSFQQQHPETKNSIVEADIPSKPKIILETSKEKLPAHSSRTSKKRATHSVTKDSSDDIPSHVERIQDESLRISPGADSEIEYHDRMYQRDRDAQVRGQKALEKERIHREYKDLLKKLPALQRQERICEISEDKPEYHMSDERLKERERKRQNKMDNAYEKAFPQRRPAVVTIPPKIHTKPNVNLTPFKIVDASDGSPTLNLGQWDIEQVPAKVEANESGEDGPTIDRREQLKELLQSLHQQKQMLLEEIKALPKDSNLDEVLKNLSSISMEKKDQKRPSQDQKRASEDQKSAGVSKLAPSPGAKSDKTIYRSRPREKSKRRRSPDEIESANTTTESVKLDSGRSLSREEKMKKRHERCFTSDSGATVLSPSPRKKPKMKYKKRTIILQNSGTQTTPSLLEKNAEPKSQVDKVTKAVKERQESKSSTERPPFVQEKEVCSKKHIPCDCYTDDKTVKTGDVCQIVIKIKENEKPEILVQQSQGKEKVTVVQKDPETRDKPSSEASTTSPKVAAEHPGGKHKDRRKKDHAKAKTVHLKTKESQPQTKDGHTKTKESQPQTKDGHTKTKESQPKTKDTQIKTKDSQPKTKKDAVVKQKSPSEKSGEEKKTARTTSDSTDSKLKPVTCAKQKSWREQLSKNSSEDTTTTSYYSPPDFAKKVTQSNQPQAQSTFADLFHRQLPKTCSDFLKKKPQQENLHSSTSTCRSEMNSASMAPSRQLDTKLLRSVRKLISMSRKNIDELAASTVSEASTPSQSIIDMESNSQLSNILKYFSIDVADLQQQLSYSSDGSNAHLRAQENLTLSSSDGSQIFTQNRSLHNNISTPKSSMEIPVCSFMSDLKQKPSEDSITTKNLSRYSEIAETCNKRISNLTAMIEKVREEKMRMLQSPAGSEPDQSTKYLEPPCPGLDEHRIVDGIENKSSSSTSTDEDLLKNLLKVDYSLSGQLSTKAVDEEELLETSHGEKAEEQNGIQVSMSDSDRHLFLRLQKLLQNSGRAARDAAKQLSNNRMPCKDRSVNFCFTEVNPNVKLSSPVQINEAGDVGFVPLLLDIPKLPKLTGSSREQSEAGDSSHHRRPPPSRGLSIVRRFNGDISVIPHELSTIAEADSQVSTRIEQSPRGSRSCLVTPQKPAEETVDSKLSVKSASSEDNKTDKKNRERPCNGGEDADLETQVEIARSKTSADKKSRSTSTSSRSLVELLNEINKSMEVMSDKSSTAKVIDLSQNVLKPSTSSSSDDKSDLEKMLHSIGMDWAAATLRKTKEALALSSSSSSLDLNVKSKISVKSSDSCSDVSLKEFLAKQLIAKVSSSTLKSEASPSSLLGESQELSAIQYSMEKSHHRTSTPIQSNNKDLDKQKSPQKAVFTGESDISSVRDNSQDIQKQVTFYSLSETSSHS